MGIDIPPLCIIQARYHSTRLPGKMLLDFGGETLIARAWRIACEAFGLVNCVCTVPLADWEGPLGEELQRIGALTSPWTGDENDVLGRFHALANTCRWHPDSVIVRYTPDDPWKRVEALRRVAAGERLPVELGGEAFTLGMLNRAFESADPNEQREHLTHLLFRFPAPPIAVQTLYELGTQCLTIDTQQDYETALAALPSVPQ